MIVLETTLGSQNSLSDFKNLKSHKIFCFLEVRALFSGSSNRKNPGNFRFFGRESTFFQFLEPEKFPYFSGYFREKNTGPTVHLAPEHVSRGSTRNSSTGSFKTLQSAPESQISGLCELPTRLNQRLYGHSDMSIS